MNLGKGILRSLAILMFVENAAFADSYRRGRIDCEMWATVEDVRTPPTRLPYTDRLGVNLTWVLETGRVVTEDFHVLPDTRSTSPFPTALQDELEAGVTETFPEKFLIVGDRSVTRITFSNRRHILAPANDNANRSNLFFGGVTAYPNGARTFDTRTTSSLMGQYLLHLGATPTTTITDFMAEDNWRNGVAGGEPAFPHLFIRYWSFSRLYDLGHVWGLFYFDTGSPLVLQVLEQDGGPSYHLVHQCALTMLP